MKTMPLRLPLLAMLLSGPVLAAAPSPFPTLDGKPPLVVAHRGAAGDPPGPNQEG